MPLLPFRWKNAPGVKCKMLNFCTLYNSNYAAKGLAMYWSLRRVCPEFMLYVFAFDDVLAEALKKMALPQMTVITLAEFEDEELLRVKPTRTAGEYCWTCSSSTIYYCLTHFGIDHCTYIDSDMYFYANPQVLIDEMGDDDVLITSHRYSPQYQSEEKAGKYCVQFMTFKNSENGMKVLKWWRDRCLEWCYNRYEDGKFGDQKYLDDWTTRFEGVHELQHLGGGVAPWNMQQYTFRQQGDQYIGTEIATGKEFPLVFFHFHACHCYRKGWMREFQYVWYEWNKKNWDVLFKAYAKELIHAYRAMRKTDKNIDGVATQLLLTQSWLDYVLRIRYRKYKQKDFRSYYWIG